jgi:hypothetical protein
VQKGTELSNPARCDHLTGLRKNSLGSSACLVFGDQLLVDRQNSSSKELLAYAHADHSSFRHEFNALKQAHGLPGVQYDVVGTTET